ncbi:MAG: 4-hydroxythreonine-4-phosphate dehydrogenase PdxA [Nitratireductor sp.]|nr:4-hydroxythreonine-4-phosphate dehydrogenase PdxA [Nitratireductor sp.]
MTPQAAAVPPLATPLAVTLGEPAGIGPEVILKSWLQRRQQALAPFFVVGDARILDETARQLGLGVEIGRTTPAESMGMFASALPVVDAGAPVSGLPGQPSDGDGPAISGYIREAVSLVHSGAAGGIVTAPINKLSLYRAGFKYPGHTEFLAALAQEYWGEPVLPVMMLAGPELRTVPVTIHIPLAQVPGQLTTERVAETLRITHRDLVQRFGIAAPRIAVAGLNPHAGEGGSLGREDDAIIAPAVHAAREAGIDARGPLPADTLFHARARAGHDCVICMYHDQALIPAKTLAFDEAVNITLGLPFIRTSPDHGTALDIAGGGKADPSSMIAAIRLAGRLAANGAAPA